MLPTWLALICTGQVQGEETEHIKRGSQDRLRFLLWGWHILMPQACAFLCLPNKTLSCNTAQLFQTFTAARQNWGNHTSTKNIWGSDLDVTWLKQPQLGPSGMEAKHRRSPTWWKLTLCKLNTKETQSSRSQEKPSTLETRTAKPNSGESSCNTVSDFRRPPGKVESPRSCGWKDKWLTKS